MKSTFFLSLAWLYIGKNINLNHISPYHPQTDHKMMQQKKKKALLLCFEKVFFEDIDNALHCFY